VKQRAQTAPSSGAYDARHLARPGEKTRTVTDRRELATLLENTSKRPHPALLHI
jgi:hypothetical protein